MPDPQDVQDLDPPGLGVVRVAPATWRYDARVGKKVPLEFGHDAVFHS